jgi:hypothetical protein
MDALSELMGVRPATEIRRDIEELAKLGESRGWAVLAETMAKEREIATRALTSSPTTTREELDFYRATLRAIDLMTGLPGMIKKDLELQLRIADTMKPAKEETDASR